MVGGIVELGDLVGRTVIGLDKPLRRSDFLCNSIRIRTTAVIHGRSVGQLQQRSSRRIAVRVDIDFRFHHAVFQLIDIPIRPLDVQRQILQAVVFAIIRLLPFGIAQRCADAAGIRPVTQTAGITFGQCGRKVRRSVPPIGISRIGGTFRFGAHLQGVFHLQFDAVAQNILRDGPALAVHPGLSEVFAGQDGVGQVVHGDVASRLIRTTLLRDRTVRWRSGIGLRHRLDNLIDPRHTVGGVAFQPGDGVGPAVQVAFNPSDLALRQCHRLQADRVALPRLAVGPPLQRQCKLVRPEAEDIVQILPDFVAGQGDRSRITRFVEEAGVDAGILVRAQIANAGRTLIRILFQFFNRLVTTGGPGIVAAQAALVLGDGIDKFRAVGRVDGQIFKCKCVLYRYVPVPICICGRSHSRFHLSGVPGLRLYREGLRRCLIVRRIGAGQLQGDGRVAFQTLGHRQVFDG